jgi:hypothetical protein
MPVIAIAVEGVLRKISGGAPIPEGLDLYYGLATRARLVLLTEDPEPAKKELGPLEYWLQTEGMREHARVIYTDAVGRELDAAHNRLLQVNWARNWGYAVGLVIEPDPQVAAYLLLQGINVLLFCPAAYMMPSWRPDYHHEPQPWAELAQRVEDEVYLRAADKRRESDA